MKRLLLAFCAVLFLAYPAGTHSIPYVLNRQTILSVRTERNQTLGSSVSYGPVVLTSRHILTAWKGPVYIYNKDVLLSTEVLCDGSDEIDFSVLFVHGLVASTTRGQGKLPDRGETLWVAGYPKGEWVVRTVVVLGIEENVQVYGEDGSTVLRRVITVYDSTGNASRPGISGGGLFNLRGELLGIVCCVQVGTGWIGVVPLVDGLTECQR